MRNTHPQLMQALGIASLMGLLVWGGCSTKSTVEATSAEELSGFSKRPVEEKVRAPMVVARAEPSGKTIREPAARELSAIYFPFDRWALSDEGKKILVDNSAMLKQHPEARLEIDGYCDERGSREYNLVLGEKRAQATARYLTALGVTNPVHVNSFGKERLVCNEHDEACYWKNRRANLVLQAGP